MSLLHPAARLPGGNFGFLCTVHVRLASATADEAIDEEWPEWGEGYHQSFCINATDAMEALRLLQCHLAREPLLVCGRGGVTSIELELDSTSADEPEAFHPSTEARGIHYVGPQLFHGCDEPPPPRLGEGAAALS